MGVSGSREFQVFGMRCSGTNYLERLLVENFLDSRVVTKYGWKHGGFGFPWRLSARYSPRRQFMELVNPETASSKTVFFVIWRDPISWLQSIHRSPHHAPHLIDVDFAQFIRARWDAFYNINYPGEDFAQEKTARYAIAEFGNNIERFDSVFTLRKEKYKRFSEMCVRAENIVYVNYEILRENVEQFIECIADIFEIEKGPFRDFSNEKHGGGVFAPKPLAEIAAYDLALILESLCLYSEAGKGYYFDVKRLRALCRNNQFVSGDEIMRCVEVERRILVKRGAGEQLREVVPGGGHPERNGLVLPLRQPDRISASAQVRLSSEPANGAGRHSHDREQGPDLPTIGSDQHAGTCKTVAVRRSTAGRPSSSVLTGRGDCVLPAEPGQGQSDAKAPAPRRKVGPMSMLRSNLASLTRRMGSVGKSVLAPREAIYMGDKLALTRSVYGHKLFVDTDDLSLTPHILVDGVWESWITTVFRRSMRRGMTVVDVGANVGWYSILAADLVGPQGRLVAFEANPRLADIAYRNLSINGFAERSTVEAKAVYAETTTLEFKIFERFKGGSSLFTNEAVAETYHDQLRRLEVPAVRLDDYFAPGTRVDFLKIDAEGAEGFVLRGAGRVLADNPQISILMEFAPATINAAYGEAKRFLDEIATLGFRVQRITDDATLVPTDLGDLEKQVLCDVLLTR